MFRRTITLASSVALLTTAAGGATSASADEPEEQWRSYWADSFNDSIYTPENVSKLVADAKEINANVLIVQVSRWMDCFCNRSTFPRTHVEIDPEFDPLDDVIEKAHAAGIEVHAWVNATPMWNASYDPPDPDHIFNTHGHDADGADRWLNRRVDGSEVGGSNLRTIDPANPGAVNYVVDGIESIASEYDVDGINLDFIRYPDYNEYEGNDYHSDWGYSDVSIQRFQAATGRTDIPEPSDEQFSDWRRDQMTSFMRKIFLSMYQVDSQDAVSINGITYWYGPQTEGGWEATRTYSEVLQDWRAWLDEGIVDVNVAMNYKVETNEGDRIQMFDEWTETLADNQFDRFAVNGPALYLNSVEDSIAQARRGLASTAAGNQVVGWSGYSYASPSNGVNEEVTADEERARLAEMLTNSDPSGEEPLFAEPANVPEMTWKTKPTAGHVVGELTTINGAGLDQVNVSLENIKTGETIDGRVTDGSGWFGFVDVAPGKWLVHVDLPSGVAGQPVSVVKVTKGEVATARFGPFVDLP